MSQADTKTTGRGARVPRILSQSIEENSEFEEIQADDGQRSNVTTIRQNVPSKSSSAA